MSSSLETWKARLTRYQLLCSFSKVPQPPPPLLRIVWIRRKFAGKTKYNNKSETGRLHLQAVLFLSDSDGSVQVNKWGRNRWSGEIIDVIGPVSYLVNAGRPVMSGSCVKLQTLIYLKIQNKLFMFRVLCFINSTWLKRTPISNCTLNFSWHVGPKVEAKNP